MKHPILIADAQLEKLSGFGNFNPNETGGQIGALGQLGRIFSTLIGFLTIVGGLAFLIYFIIGALNWITAGGDAKKVDTAKSYMTNGAVGMIIIVASYAIIWIVGQVLGFQILDPAFQLQQIIDGITGNSGPATTPTNNRNGYQTPI